MALAVIFGIAMTALVLAGIALFFAFTAHDRIDGGWDDCVKKARDRTGKR